MKYIYLNVEVKIVQLNMKMYVGQMTIYVRLQDLEA